MNKADSSQNATEFWEKRARELAVENTNLRIALRELAKLFSLNNEKE